jgi:hypothetical protein
MWGTACFACGAVFGLIFGIPPSIETKAGDSSSPNGSLVTAQAELAKAKQATVTAQSALDKAKAPAQPGNAPAKPPTTSQTLDKDALNALQSDLDDAVAKQSAAEYELKLWVSDPEELEVMKNAALARATALQGKNDDASITEAQNQKAIAKRIGQVEDEGARQKKSTYGANTNLTDISDWLTKIIVGVGLVQLGKIRALLKSAATFVAAGLVDSKKSNADAGVPVNAPLGNAGAAGPINNPAPNTVNLSSIALGIILYFLVVGFLSSYLLARIWLPRLLEGVG